MGSLQEEYSSFCLSPSLSVSACDVYTACMRAHCLRACLHGHSVCAYARRAWPWCVRAHGVRTCTRRACVYTACMVRTCARRAYVHTSCARTHGMRLSVCLTVCLCVQLNLSHGLSDWLHTACVRAHSAIAVVRRSASQPARMLPPPLCAAQLSPCFYLGAAPLGFTHGP
jgi:hypothetical protein